ncbi:MAG TPA: squalene synthase HpnC [Burkholderiales bacterium]|nr:squalene synthase HpnC [Burkholderiales bacterium]
MSAAISHYENFPVASWILPQRLRRPVRLIYAFARAADDFADEGDLTPQQRLGALRELSAQLECIAARKPPAQPLFVELASVIERHGLPLQPFRDLLSAFQQDVTKTRYADFGEVMDYCRRSANPIGRLLLHLYGESAPRSLALADGICASLQLINFLQDIEIDYRKGRVYLAQDEMARYAISEAQIALGDVSGNWPSFMRDQIDRAHRMLQAGAPLGRVLRGRVGMELRMIILGGECILKKLHDTGGDVFRFRPTLGRRDWLYMFYRALLA